MGADGDAQVCGQLLGEGLRVGAGELLQQRHQLLQHGKVTGLQLWRGREAALAQR